MSPTGIHSSVIAQAKRNRVKRLEKIKDPDLRSALGRQTYKQLNNIRDLAKKRSTKAKRVFEKMRTNDDWIAQAADPGITRIVKHYGPKKENTFIKMIRRVL